MPEVDAVADVSPVTPFHLWKLRHFPWLGNLRDERPEADPDGDRVPNLLEYAVGRNPTNAETDVVLHIGSCPTGAVGVTCFVSTNSADAIVRFVAVEELSATNWTSANVTQQMKAPAPDGRLRVTGCLAPTIGRGFIRLEVQEP